MKPFQYIFILIFCLGAMVACQDDFDELNDTDQRYIIFTFNTDSLFAHVLRYDGGYSFPQIDTLPSGFYVRITAYCYDEKGDLFHSQKLLTSVNTKPQMKIRHLVKANSYRFAFIADIVEYNPQADYYEAWFHLSSSSWETLYLYSDKRHDDATYDMAGFYTLEIEPADQTTEIRFEPITYNGYCIFTQLQSVDHLSGAIMPVVSFKIHTLQWMWRAVYPYELDYRNPNEDIVLPVSLSYADSIITARIITNTLTGIDTTTHDIHNPNRRPFVVTFNCNNHTVENCTFY